MIISHKHKYLFVELPLTASTAISKELCDTYDGAPILRKHARYHEFLKIAKPDEKNYFVFSCIRNPLDTIASQYFKRKTNHKGNYTKMERWLGRGRHVRRHALEEFDFVKNTGADFPAFFKKFYKLPYDNWSSLAHKEFDFVIRFENLQDDFAEVLELLGIEQKRPLPLVNKTSEKQDFLAYYTPEIYEQARRVCGPFMKKWGYDFPPEWGDNSVPWSSQIQFYVLGFWRKLFRWSTLSDTLLSKRLFNGARQAIQPD